MSFTHTLTQKLQHGGSQVSQDVSATGGAEINIDEAIPDASTDLAITCALDVSALQMIYILSDQALTLEANDTVTPDFTLALAAGVPLIEHANDYHASLLTADVTRFYATNSSGAVANLKIRAVQDPTP